MTGRNIWKTESELNDKLLKYRDYPRGITHDWRQCESHDQHRLDPATVTNISHLYMLFRDINCAYNLGLVTQKWFWIHRCWIKTAIKSVLDAEKYTAGKRNIKFDPHPSAVRLWRTLLSLGDLFERLDREHIDNVKKFNVTTAKLLSQ